MASQGTESQRHTLQGSCHCGQIIFTAHNVAFGGIHKCNCAFCVKTGLFHVSLDPGSIRLHSADGSLDMTLTWQTPIPYGYASKLAYYMSNGEKSRIRWYSCANCHILLFTCNNYLNEAEGGRCSVSLRCLDLRSTGESMTSLTKPDRLMYYENAHDTDQGRRGEPYEPGDW